MQQDTHASAAIELQHVGMQVWAFRLLTAVTSSDLPCSLTAVHTAGWQMAVCPNLRHGTCIEAS